MSEHDDLVVRVGALTGSVENLRKEMAEENVKRDVRIATNRRLNKTGIGAAIAAVVGVVVAVVISVHFSNQSTERGKALGAQIEQNERDRAEARRTGCDQYNEQQRSAYAAEIVQARILVRALVPNLSVVDDETRRRVASYYAEHDRQSAISHRERDCSPAGIAAYFAGKGRGEAYLPVPTIPTTTP